MKPAILVLLLFASLQVSAQSAITDGYDNIVITIGKQSKGFVSADDLCNDPVIRISQKGFTVESASISILKKGATEIEGPYTITGAELKKEGNCWFAGMAAGDRVFIDDIKITGPDGRWRMANPLAYTIR